MNAHQPSAASRTTPSPVFLFVVGAPRSGTSWIQKSLAQQAGWITVPELHYAREVLRPVLLAWNGRAADLDETLVRLASTGHQTRRMIGMPASLEFDDLARALRAPIQSLVARASATFGRVDVLVEKTPSNSLLTPYISQIFPEAFVLHVLRDPRSMVSSLRSASSTEWGRGWAPRSVLVCALMWRAFVSGARRGRESAPRYLEVKYEDALRSLPAELANIRMWLAMPPSVDSLVDNLHKDRHEVVSARVASVLGEAAIPEPDDFGDGSRRRPELTPVQLWLVEAVTARLMEEYRYVIRYRSARWANRVLERLAAPVIVRLSASRKERIALNLRRLRLLPWLCERARGLP